DNKNKTRSNQCKPLINEFIDMPKIMFGGFPDLFLIGGYLLSDGPLSKDFIDYILSYYDGRFVQNVQLMFLLGNMRQRHEFLPGLAFAIKTNSKATREFINCVNSAEFKANVLLGNDDVNG